MPEYFPLIFVAILGAILGSFINALSFRFNTGRGWGSMGGRSRCMQCSKTLGIFDLVPIFSYFFLKGRCRYCFSKISWQYPSVEIVAALLAVLVYVQYPIFNFQFAISNQFSILNFQTFKFFFWLLVWMILLFTVIYDLKHKIIPWSCSLLLAALSLVMIFVFVYPEASPQEVLWSLSAGPLLALPLFLISLISGGRWMGWGDSALELSLGWFLGLTAGLTALMLAFWVGAAVGIFVLVLRKGFTIKSELPFAPFLVLGAAVAYFAHVDFFTTLPLLF